MFQNKIVSLSFWTERSEVKNPIDQGIKVRVDPDFISLIRGILRSKTKQSLVLKLRMTKRSKNNNLFWVLRYFNISKFIY